MFLDIKLGLLWAFLVGLLFGHPFTPLWILAGVGFALLPDLDFWIEYLKRGTVGGKVIDLHRTLLHTPLTYLPVTLFVGSWFGPAWMTLFALGVFGHHVHDSMGMGYGIRWLWPLSTRWYKLFSGKDGEIHYDHHHLLASWDAEEMKTLVAERGNDHWIEEESAYMRREWKKIVGRLCLMVVVIVLLIAILPL